MRVSLMALLVSLAAQAVSAAEPPATVTSQDRSPNSLAKPKSNPAIIGHLETRNRVVTIYAGSTYTVKTKDGKILAEKVSTKALQAKFPDIHKLIQTGIAKDGSYLDGRLHSRVR